jgi:hypothetical protein
MSASDPDWQDAFTFQWRAMDFEKKLAATKGMRDRVGFPDDPAVKSLPVNYLKQEKWDREIRAPSNGIVATAKGPTYLQKRLREAEARESGGK